MVDGTLEDDVDAASDGWRGSSARNGIRWTTFAIRPSMVGQLVRIQRPKEKFMNQPIRASNSVSLRLPLKADLPILTVWTVGVILISV